MKKGDYIGKENPNYRHGMKGTRFYSVWVKIKSRCTNKKIKDYSFYGGRGIKTIWYHFDDFFEDMYESYVAHIEKFGERNTTIERINNDGNYFRKNCRWATRAEQLRNTRRTNLITFNGETLCLVDWAKRLGIKRSTLSNRINVYGWSIDKALTTMVK